MSVNFAPLRVHSEYSIENGMIRVKEYVKQCKEEGIPAACLADSMNMFGVVKFYKLCRSMGVKPLIGCEINFKYKDELGPKGFSMARLMLIAINPAGYTKLCELLTDAYLDETRMGEAAFLTLDSLKAKGGEGLICLSGGIDGPFVGMWEQGRKGDVERLLDELMELFKDSFYLEIQRLKPLPNDFPRRPDFFQFENRAKSNEAMVYELCQGRSVPVVATHPAYFLSMDDFEAHEAKTCVVSGGILDDLKRPVYYHPSQYLLGAQEMEELFADVPEALENSLEIAKRCSVFIEIGNHYLPIFPTGNGMNLDDYLVHTAKQGLEERLDFLYPDPEEKAKRRPEYDKRLDYELGVIIKMQFPGYFLIVADFINWAKNNGCPVGPGRGSGAGSLVAYALKITDLDPLRYALLFERFLNPERVSMPDFDVDFCQENRGRVIEYVKSKYGYDAVSQIVTFGTMSSKAIIKDVGRVLSLPHKLCDRLSKLVPIEQNHPVSLKDALEKEPEIGRIIQEEHCERLMKLCLRLENLTRQTGKHAGGVLIAPGKLTDFCPIYIAKDKADDTVSMYDKEDVEQVGLVKFDFLGLRNLTTIQLAKDYIKLIRGEDLDLDHISLEDQDVYRIFSEGNTVGVFQFESDGMRKMLMQAKPTKFEEIIAFVALYRPGPMDLIPDYIARMQGAHFEYTHPSLEKILDSTYGIMVYQEQVMQVAQVCGNFSLGGADLLRRAMGKKKFEEMAKQKVNFMKGARENGIPDESAEKIYADMEKFAGYGFNKSHAAAYSLVSYQTAFLKRHFTCEYMAAVMSADLSKSDQTLVFIRDCKRNGIEILPPDVNKSHYNFMPESETAIRFALGAFNGAGEAAMNMLVEEREKNGPYKSMFDLCKRLGGNQNFNKKALEALVTGGAFDSLERDRSKLMANVSLALQFGQESSKRMGQNSLFDDFVESPEDEVEMVAAEPWSKMRELEQEYQTLGFYFSSHPYLEYKAELDKLRLPEWSRLGDLRGAWVAGYVSRLQRAISKKDGKVYVRAFLTNGESELDVFVPEDFKVKTGDKLKSNMMAILNVRINRKRPQNPDDPNEPVSYSYTAMDMRTIEEARNAWGDRIYLMLKKDADPRKLAKIIERNRDGNLISNLVPHVACEKDGYRGEFEGQPFYLTDALMEELETSDLLDVCEITYHPMRANA